MLVQRPRLLHVAFHLPRRAQLRLLRALAELPPRPPLAQQVPALVQRLFDRPQPLTLLGAGQLAVGDLGAQVVLGRDELVDVAQDLLVIHDANARRPPARAHTGRAPSWRRPGSPVTVPPAAGP